MRSYLERREDNGAGFDSVITALTAYPVSKVGPPGKPWDTIVINPLTVDVGQQGPTLKEQAKQLYLTKASSWERVG